jgi:ABC-type Fe3+-hydroxamate transport system substrate-binding protein
LRALFLGIALVCLQADGTPVRIVAVDDAGDTLRLNGPARRVVSLDPTTTELLFAIGAGSTLVGRTDACDFPTEAKRVPSLGGGIPPNIEAVAGARPDLVLLYHAGLNAQPAARLRDLGIPLARLRTDRLDDVPRLTRMLGELTGAGRAADSVAETYARDLARQRATSLGARTAPLPVVIVAWDQPLIVLGAGSYVSQAVELAGARNVFGDIPSPSAQVTLEAVVDRAPRAIIAMSASGAAFSRPEWRALSAAREQHVVRLEESAYNHPGPRMPAAIHALRARLAEIP